MRKCIICLKTKKEKSFNIEHIIPDSLGGNIKINCCCSECNSKLGRNVDTRLTELDCTEVVRHLLKIKGRNGVPNPFKQLFSSPVKGVDGYLKFDKNGQFQKFEVLTKPIVNSENEFTIVSDSLPKMINSINKKIGKDNQKPFTEEEIRKNITSIALPSPKSISISGVAKDDMEGYCIYMLPAILKIAYEFAWIKLGDRYLEKDRVGKDIRGLLYNASYELATHVDMPTSITVENLTLKSAMRYHSINLCIENEAIFCSVNILNFVKAKILISEQAEIYENVDENIVEINF